ncbi:hypothetical protein, partial [Pseudomonas sp. B1(2018)]|uniref:hypothetical protein n=1 Tax=Pseudomonas sp. B1(2018) TaxID=2233856 RepID=UPI001057F6DF
MQKRRERIAAFLFEDQKIAAFGSSYRGSRSNVGAAEGCDLLKLDAVSLKHRAPHNSAVNPTKELPMAFKLIEHGTGDLILGETQMQKRRERIAAFLFEDQKIAAFGSSYRGSRSNVGAAEGCDLLKLDAVSLK